MADTVLQFIDLIWEYGASLSIDRDGEAEISTTHEPLGVVLISPEDQRMLFIHLTIACVTGNAVVLVSEGEISDSFAPYCDLLSTCGFPHGVINSLFTKDLTNLLIDRKIVDRILRQSFILSNLFGDGDEKILARRRIFLRVTKPKSIWLQCA